MAQRSPANAKEVLAPKISLLVTASAQQQAFSMPSFVGQPLGSVSRILQDAGFKLGNVSVIAPPAAVATGDAANPAVSSVPTPPTIPAQPSPASIVASQAPLPVQNLYAGTVVSFEVR